MKYFFMYKHCTAYNSKLLKRIHFIVLSIKKILGGGRLLHPQKMTQLIFFSHSRGVAASILFSIIYEAAWQLYKY